MSPVENQRKINTPYSLLPTPYSPIVFSDFDGTITEGDAVDEILTRFADPSWRELEQEWAHGAIGSRECLARQMALVDASEPELEALIDSVTVDPHFPAFLRFTRAAGVAFHVVSDGFDYIISRVLERAGVAGELTHNGQHLFSSVLRVEGRRCVATFPRPACEHGCATCKPEVIRDVVRQVTRQVIPRRGGARPPVVFIGDGLSDRFAVEQADVVFAKRRLLDYCRECGIGCHAFETFADIERELRRMTGAPTGEIKRREANGKKRTRRALALTNRD
ncbi:MAG TPA: MtnX-like HAD-IB family phosphatase [Terriglobia bacterium]|nr:MtnX-like HAD-IB family phosphatase [Terriglobia bacterium]